jgi:cell division protein FtsL
MAKLKSYPKRPKASASVAVMERYLQRCKDIDKQNAEIKKEASRKEALKKQISKIGRAK